jgi:hypothetical protein
MLIQKLRLSWALAVACIFAAFVMSAPAPEDKVGPEEEAAEPAKATEEEALEHFKKSENNLKQIGLAFHNYAATFAEPSSPFWTKKNQAIRSTTRGKDNHWGVRGKWLQIWS